MWESFIRGFCKVEFLCDAVVGHLQGAFGLVCGRDRDHLGVAEQEADDRQFHEPVIHHEADGPFAGAGDDQPVDEADVVAHEQGRTLHRNTFAVLRL